MAWEHEILETHVSDGAALFWSAMNARYPTRLNAWCLSYTFTCRFYAVKISNGTPVSCVMCEMSNEWAIVN